MTLFRLVLTALLLSSAQAGLDSVQAGTPDSVSSRLMVHVSENHFFRLPFWQAVMSPGLGRKSSELAYTQYRGLRISSSRDSLQ
jgi:hypothetical protein